MLLVIFRNAVQQVEHFHEALFMERMRYVKVSWRILQMQ